jgi:hypothetical protein
VSAGTTTWALARWLPLGVTVLTNSISLAEELRRTGSESTVILTGGIRTPSDALVGPVADAAIRSFYVDVLILGVHDALDPVARDSLAASVGDLVLVTPGSGAETHSQPGLATVGLDGLPRW